ncbi:MAG TPA: acyltransferase family protein [Clostridiaceae bacterium]|nr:acyltransferase family protein [Clostridiaceae bacterium]
MPARIKALDYIRVIATLAVIAIHVSSTYTLSNDIAYIINQSMRFAIPVFFILSGAAIFYSHYEKGRINYMVFVRKRFVKIVVPFILWTLIYLIYDAKNDISQVLSARFG